MTELVAELSSNHGGSRYWIEHMLDNAAHAQFDRVKFQSFQTRHLNPADPQFAWFKQAELSDQDHKWILEACASRGLRFLTTAFHEDRVRFLADLGLSCIKIGSGEGGRKPLLEAVAKHNWTVYLSTGLMTLPELHEANAILKDRKVILMHTVSEYPTEPSHVNMGRMYWLALETNRTVGYSDHTEGLAAARLAICLGAAVVEVHVKPSIPAGRVLPRSNVWDKSPSEMRRLRIFRDTVEKMKGPGRMTWPLGEERPYVGRWTYRAGVPVGDGGGAGADPAGRVG